MQVEVLKIDGEKTGRKVELPDDIFGVEPNQHVVYLAVKQYLAAQRQGTHKVNRKVKDLAKISALSFKAKDNAIVVVEDMSLDTPKTKSFTDMLGNLEV